MSASVSNPENMMGQEHKSISKENIFSIQRLFVGAKNLEWADISYRDTVMEKKGTLGIFTEILLLLGTGINAFFNCLI